MRFIPWPHQERTIPLLTQAFIDGCRAVGIVIPTGGGKTPTACMFIARAVAKGKSVLFVAHRLELLTQASEKLDQFGLAHGIIAPQYKQTTDRVQVASVQTLVRRLNKLPWVPDIICVDEFHLSAAPTYKKIFAAFPKAFKIGLSATPGRLDQKGLGVHCGGDWDHLIQPTSMQELIDGGYLVKPRVYAPSTPDLTGLRHIGGDFDQAQLAELMDKKSLVGDVVAHWKRLAAGRPTMAFCVSILHAEHVAEQFRAAGVRAKAVSGETPVAERLDAVKALGDGRLDVVANCSLFVEGLDQKLISCIVLLSPTESLTRYLQSVGRGMRAADGKKDCIILDHAGCSNIHGLPQEPREWTLDGKAKRKADDDGERVQRCRMCQRCFAMSPVWRQDCEQCHAPFEAHREPPKQVDGELQEVTEEQKEFMRRAQATLNRQRGFEESQADSLEALQKIAKARGYAPQWAYIRWQHKKKRKVAA